jgi:hypothetical protein
LETFSTRDDQSIKALIELGSKGFFPLFQPEWMLEMAQDYRRQLSGKDRSRAKEMMGRMAKHRTIERKKIVLMAASEEDRRSFIKAFIKLVEGKILNSKWELQ